MVSTGCVREKPVELRAREHKNVLLGHTASHHSLFGYLCSQVGDRTTVHSWIQWRSEVLRERGTKVSGGSQSKNVSEGSQKA